MNSCSPPPLSPYMPLPCSRKPSREEEGRRHGRGLRKQGSLVAAASARHAHTHIDARLSSLCFALAREEPLLRSEKTEREGKAAAGVGNSAESAVERGPAHCRRRSPNRSLSSSSRTSSASSTCVDSNPLRSLCHPPPPLRSVGVCAAGHTWELCRQECSIRSAQVLAARGPPARGLPASERSAKEGRPPRSGSTRDRGLPRLAPVVGNPSRETLSRVTNQRSTAAAQRTQATNHPSLPSTVIGGLHPEWRAVAPPNQEGGDPAPPLPVRSPAAAWRWEEAPGCVSGGEGREWRWTVGREGEEEKKRVEIMTCGSRSRYLV
jgi:hypothetical protein